MSLLYLYLLEVRTETLVSEVCVNTSISCSPAAKFNLKQMLLITNMNLFAECLVACSKKFPLDFYTN
jgi:hypothetical protein